MFSLAFSGRSNGRTKGLALLRLALVSFAFRDPGGVEIVRKLTGVGLLACSIWLAMGPAYSFAGPPQDHQQLKVIAESYRANKAAFAHGKCRFTYSIRTARNEADAIAGKWSNDREHVTSEMTLYFRGDTVTVKTKLDNDRLVAAIEHSEPVITPINIAVKGGFAIDHDGLLNAAIVHSPSSNHLNIRMHPFNLADDSQSMDPASILEYSEALKFDGVEMTVEEHVVRDGREYVLINRSAKDDSHDARYYIDPEQGYLPIVTEYYEKDGQRALYSRMLLLDVHREDNACFPMRSIKLLTRKNADNNDFQQVREMKVVELDLQYQPTAEDFTLRLPKHTQYSDGVNPNSAKSLFRDKGPAFAAVSVNDIEGLYGQLQNLAAGRAKDEVIVRSRPARGSQQWYWVIGTNLLALGVIIVILLRRRSAARISRVP